MVSKKNRPPTTETIENLTKGLVDIAGTGPNSIRRSVQVGIVEGIRKGFTDSFKSQMSQQGPTPTTILERSQQLTKIISEPKTISNIISPKILNESVQDSFKTKQFVSPEQQKLINPINPAVFDSQTTKETFKPVLLNQESETNPVKPATFTSTIGDFFDWLKEKFSSVFKNIFKSDDGAPKVTPITQRQEQLRETVTQPKSIVNLSGKTQNISDFLNTAVKDSMGTAKISSDIQTETVSKRPELISDQLVGILQKLSRSFEDVVPVGKRLKQVEVSAEELAKMFGSMGTQLPLMVQQVLSGYRIDLPQLQVNPDAKTSRPIPVVDNPAEARRGQADLAFFGQFIESFRKNFVDIKPKTESFTPKEPPKVAEVQTPEPMLPKVIKSEQLVKPESNKKMEGLLQSISNNDCCEQLMKSLSDILDAIKSGGGGGGRGGKKNKNDDDEGIFRDPYAPFTKYLEGIIKTLADQVDNLQRTLLGFSTDVPKFQKFLGDSVEGLKGDAIKNLANAAELYGRGFRENNRGLLTVANRMDLTNQNSKVLLEEIPRLAVAFRIGSDSMNELGVNINKFAIEYGVSTQRLIEELSKSKATKTAGELGFGQQFAENMAELQAKFPQAAEKIREFTDAVTSGGKEYQMLIAAGAGDAVRRFEQAAKLKNPEEFQEAFMDIARAMSKLDQKFVGMAETVGNSGQSMIFTFNQIKDYVGTGGVLATDVLNSMENNKKSINKVAEANKKYEDSLKATIDQIKTNLLPVVVAFLTALKALLAPLQLITGNVFGQFAVAILLLRGTLLGLVTSLTLFSKSLAAARASLASTGGGGMGAATGFLAGPWGLVLTAALAGGSMLLADYQAKKEERLRQTMEDQVRQQKITNSHLNANAKTDQQKLDRMADSVYKSINKDMLSLVMLLRNDKLDEHQQQVLKQLSQSNSYLARLASQTSLPSKSRIP